jgi:chromosome partitioning protein
LPKKIKRCTADFITLKKAFYAGKKDFSGCPFVGWRQTMKTIAIVNQKGGCGKTTVSINLASALSEAGQRVLLVDMDPQSHCAVGLAVPEEQIEQSVYDVLISTSRNEPIKMTEILWQISDKLELAPASIDLAAFEQQMAGINEREDCLREALADMKENYDYAIIDCPPAVGLLTFNALRAATEVVVPVETGYFALHGLSKQLETLSILCRRSGQQVNVRVLASMYDIRTKMAREILADLRSRFGDKMFDTIICFNTKIKEASSFGQPISEYDSASKGRRDFSALADEILGVEAKQQRNEFVNSLADQLESISASADELLQAAKPPVKVEPLQIEQPETDLREEELILVEEPVELALGEEIEVAEEQTSEEPLPAAVQEVETQQKSTAVKLSEYYGVTQLNDAVVFVTLYPRAHSVQIAGDFNNWQPEHHIMEKVGESGVWQTQMKLDPGRYRYRLVVDSQWQQDPYNELTELNPFGGFNSVIEVK